MLAGCGGSQSPIGASGAMPQAPAIPPPDTIAHGVPLTSSYRVVHRFDDSDGAQPQAGLINVDGTLYGTTNYGGRYGDGTVYNISVTGSEKVLHSFKGGLDGANPQAGLIDVNGTLYGTTSQGGGRSGCLGYGCGTVFRLSTTGSERVLHGFTGGSDGADPEAGLIDVNGKLYGTTGGGGSSSSGTVYSVTTNGVENVLYSFAGGSDGLGPHAGLVNVNGKLYGTTSGCGGSSCYGTVYRVTTTGSEHVLHRFTGSDGGNPLAGLIVVNDKLYGTTSAGGSAGSAAYTRGTVYRISTGGVFKVLHSFTGAPDGSSPYAGVIDVKGTLYGTTDQGGRSALYGTIYSISTTGSEQVLHRFAGGSGGAHPWAGLIIVKGTLYGTTLDGGSGCSGGGCGTVFAFTL
jgi:uncharacterized repeat protein (TIGR03803 family)